MRKSIISLLAVLGLTVLLGGVAAAQNRAPEIALAKLQRTCQAASQSGCLAKVVVLNPQGVMELTSSSCQQVRTMAVYALGEMGEARAVELLVILLQDPDRHIRRIAVRALGKIGDPRVLEPLAAVLVNDSEDLSVRCAAAWALGGLGDPRAHKVLRGTSNSPNGRLNRASREAADRLEGAGANASGSSL
jgi:HEAT repeat protein